VIHKVVLSKAVTKVLRQVPKHIVLKLHDWVEDVEERGLEKVRRIPGYHDEPCKGKLEGLRSIRLNIAYRAYYRILKSKVQFVLVEMLDKHEY